MPAMGALKAAAMAAAAPQPTRVRMAVRFTLQRRPIQLAAAAPSWVTPASSPTEAPRPTAVTVRKAMISPSQSGRLPPCSALASITSSGSIGRQRRISSATRP